MIVTSDHPVGEGIYKIDQISNEGYHMISSASVLDAQPTRMSNGSWDYSIQSFLLQGLFEICPLTSPGDVKDHYGPRVWWCFL